MILDLRWGKRARIDLDNIDDYYDRIDPSVANQIARKVVAAAFFLSEWPNAGQPFGDGPRRIWAVRSTPYVLVYRAFADYIRILRVRHNRSNWRDE